MSTPRTTPQWVEHRPLTAELFRCDLCGGQAAHVHLVPWCTDDVERVLFACEAHDPGGYHFALRAWIGDRDNWVYHLSNKGEQQNALCLLLDREQQLTQVPVKPSDFHTPLPPEPAP